MLAPSNTMSPPLSLEYSKRIHHTTSSIEIHVRLSLILTAYGSIRPHCLSYLSNHCLKHHDIMMPRSAHDLTTHFSP